MKGLDNFKKYNRGVITIQAQSLIPEKFINLLWKNNVHIKNIRKIDITTVIMEVNLRDYNLVEDIAKKTKTKTKILGRKGLSFFIMRAKRRIALFGGIIVFVGGLYYLSTFIWGIDIVTDKNISPFEIREQLKTLGIRPGIYKSKLNVYQLEETMIKKNDNIMWIKARIEGTKLSISIAERISPPDIISDETPCNLQAKRDGQIVRVYTVAGTAVVKPGDIVKSGQLVVKGEQGKEGSIYAVHAQGDVIAKTFYEEIREVPVVETKRQRTGNKDENIYVEICGKKIYLRKSLNRFDDYDKIVSNKLFIKTESLHEVKEITVNLDIKKVIDDTAAELYSKITVNLDKSVKVVDKIIESDPQGNNYRVRVAVIGEENIAIPQKIQ